MKKRTTMLMSALFAAGAFALNGNVANVFDPFQRIDFPGSPPLAGTHNQAVE